MSSTSSLSSTSGNRSGLVLLVLSTLPCLLLTGGEAGAQCGCEPVAPVATQTYRLDYRTVYDEEQVTAYRMEYETVYDERTYTVQKPVWETQTSERRYTVQKPVWETQTREERYTVQKPVWETQIQDQSYDVVRDVVETSTREERYTVMKPVYETTMQQQTQVVRKPVYETSERLEQYTVAEPVTTMQTAYSYGTAAVDTVTPVVTPGRTSLGYVPGGWAVNPYNGLASWQRGGLTWVSQPGMVVNQVNRVYQPTVTPVQVPQTTYVNRVMARRVPVQTVRYVDEQVVTQVPVQTMRMVAEEQVRQVPVQTVRKVVERVEKKVPVQVCRMVSEERVRQVPVQVCRMVSEERVEPVTTRVCKMVAEERTVKVPRVVEKRVPVTYTVRRPRTVVTRVPLDACGNPIAMPAAAAAAAPTRAAEPVPAPSLNQDSSPAKTYRSRQATAEEPVEEGWQASDREQIDPSRSDVEDRPSRVDARRPAASGTGDEAEDEAETIPAPGPSNRPGKAAVRRATPGPSVDPPPPASDLRDLPVEATSADERILDMRRDRAT